MWLPFTKAGILYFVMGLLIYLEVFIRCLSGSVTFIETGIYAYHRHMKHDLCVLSEKLHLGIENIMWFCSLGLHLWKREMWKKRLLLLKVWLQLPLGWASLWKNSTRYSNRLWCLCSLFHDLQFQRLLKSVLESSEDSFEKEKAVICYALYKMHRIVALKVQTET